MDFNSIITFIRGQFRDAEGFIPLHAPHFGGNEKKYLLETIDSTFVSSVGAFVNRFEEMMCDFTGAKYAIATTNGTTALHLALRVAGVDQGTEVITQSLTFVATANAIVHAGGIPVFVDVDKDTLGMSPAALEAFLSEKTYMDEKGDCRNKATKRKIAACIPMHTFGFPLRIDQVAAICEKFNIPLIEDAAESLGSYYKQLHTGRYGKMGTFSFNGNKTITCGGGGAIVTDSAELANTLKHLSTTAKIPHPWKFMHDEVAYNYRLPNLNAALACAQMEQLPAFLLNKKDLANNYKAFFENFQGITFIDSRSDGSANYWLNTIQFDNPEEKERFLEYTNQNKVMTRPIWQLMNKLPMYEHCEKGPLHNAEWLEDRIVNIPSSVRS